MKKILPLIVLMAALFSANVSAQTYNAVTLDETGLYSFLSMAEMRGYTNGVLRSVKPYPMSYVISVLEDINKRSRRMSAGERAVFQEYYDKFVINEDKDFWQDGDVRFQDEDENFTLELALSADMQMNAKLNELGDSGAETTVSLEMKGDMGDHISWGFDLNGGLFKVDDYDTETSYGPTAWAPYTYTKNWDGGARPVLETKYFSSMPIALSFGYSLEGEIATSFWNDSFDLRFGRLRREWARGDGSLFLDANARPFMGIDGYFSPFDWLQVSFLTGTMEYGETFRNYEDYSIKGTARTQQNMLTMLQMEITPTDWLYIALTDSCLYLKRPELGYLFPFLPPMLNQLFVGDFDNSLFGGTIELRKAGLGRAYFSLMLDEMRYGPNMLKDFRNMFSFMAGIEAPIPGLPWTTGLFQYTKIEPYAYTHYDVYGSPWFPTDWGMETGYLNGGESLAYSLEPNSDEFKLRFTSMPLTGVSVSLGYRLIRHGTGPGSTYDGWGADTSPDDDPDGAYGREDQKDFLKDGVYEWFHIYSLGGSWDLSSKGSPVAFGSEYSYIHKYYSNYPITGSFKSYTQEGYEKSNNHLLTLYVKIFP